MIRKWTTLMISLLFMFALIACDAAADHELRRRPRRRPHADRDHLPAADHHDAEHRDHGSDDRKPVSRSTTTGNPANGMGSRRSPTAKATTSC
ncbi:MAG: hypothetical protein MZU97_10575 [Bacillus subtilis]|nr:hypothetical protein [Bacillus subtilis]